MSNFPSFSNEMLENPNNEIDGIHIHQKLLYSRKDAAYSLSISIRALDYLIAGSKLQTRRLGKRIMVPVGELVRFATLDHSELICTRDHVS